MFDLWLFIEAKDVFWNTLYGVCPQYTGAANTPSWLNYTEEPSNMEISSFIFQDKSALQRNCIVMSVCRRKHWAESVNWVYEATEEFACYSYTSAKMAFRND